MVVLCASNNYVMRPAYRHAQSRFDLDQSTAAHNYSFDNYDRMSLLRCQDAPCLTFLGVVVAVHDQRRDVDLLEILSVSENALMQK
jgi:hypothetical protein